MAQSWFSFQNKAYTIRCDSKRGSLKALESKMSICFAVLLFNIAVALAGKEEAVFTVKFEREMVITCFLSLNNYLFQCLETGNCR